MNNAELREIFDAYSTEFKSIEQSKRTEMLRKELEKRPLLTIYIEYKRYWSENGRDDNPRDALFGLLEMLEFLLTKEKL